MQPELPRYAHHPGRFIYLKDEVSEEIASVPHEPVRRRADRFRFSAGPADVRWEVDTLGLEVEVTLSLPVDDAVELWSLRVRNAGAAERRLSLYPFYSIGYMSWMYLSAGYDPHLGGILARSVTPYQKLEDFETVRRLRDLTFLLHGSAPTAWETRLAGFEGEGGLHCPDALQGERLANDEAFYELPVAVLQYRPRLATGAAAEFRFLFGPARDHAEIRELRERYLGPGGFEQAGARYRAYLDSGAGREFPRTAGRSSQLVNTGTVSWLYRILIEGLFGLRGCPEGLRAEPRLSSEWPEARVVRTFRGARFDVWIRRAEGQSGTRLTVDGVDVAGTVIRGIAPGREYTVEAVVGLSLPDRVTRWRE